MIFCKFRTSYHAIEAPTSKNSKKPLGISPRGFELLLVFVKGHDPNGTKHDCQNNHKPQDQCLYVVTRLFSLADMHEEEQLNHECKMAITMMVISVAVLLII